MQHTLIFDIGKTNKKVFLFDDNYQEVEKIYTRFEEKKDEDDFPCDDLMAIEEWIKHTVKRFLIDPKYNIKAINFSAFGASFVYLDKYGKPLTPLYNYLKPIPQNILDSFYENYGDKFKIAKATASPPLAMLNSGLQLYWLKHTRPEVFKKIRYALHFPQYLSFLLTGLPDSDYTSTGCHTGL